MTPRNLGFILGVLYLGLAVLAMMPGIVVAPPSDAPPLHFDVMSGWLLGLFPVNMLLTLVHLAMGAWGLMAFMFWTRPRTYVRACAVVFGVLGVLGALPVLDTLFGAMPLYGNDIWLHLATAAAAGYVGWSAPANRRKRAADRRAAITTVAHERRRGPYDRRRTRFSP